MLHHPENDPGMILKGNFRGFRGFRGAGGLKEIFGVAVAGCFEHSEESPNTIGYNGG